LSSYFWLAGSKLSQDLRIEPRGEYVGFPYAGWCKEKMGREGGKSIHSSTPA
jgi:hypothetical protein